MIWKQKATSGCGGLINLTIMESSAGMMATCIRATGPMVRCRGTVFTPTACTAPTLATGNAIPAQYRHAALICVTDPRAA